MHSAYPVIMTLPGALRLAGVLLAVIAALSAAAGVFAVVGTLTVAAGQDGSIGLLMLFYGGALQSLWQTVAGGTMSLLCFAAARLLEAARVPR